MIKTIRGGCRGRDRMVVGFTTTNAISTYHHWCCEFESRSWRGVLDTSCDKVCHWLVAGQWFSLRTPVSSTNKTDHHDITEILLKVALNTITLKTLRYIYSETCLNWTLSKLKTCLIQTDFTIPYTKYLCNLNLCKPNKFFSPKGVRFRQVLLY